MPNVKKTVPVKVLYILFLDVPHSLIVCLFSLVSGIPTNVYFNSISCVSADTILGFLSPLSNVSTPSSADI